ncbi:MAG: UPF0149 family protein [Kangiellaceae bacterium]|jgi:yecA family protein
MSKVDLNALELCFACEGIKNSFESLYHSLGFITAMASSPEAVQPSEWIEQLVTSGKKTPDFENEDQVKVFTSNLITWWDQCNQLFDQGGTIQLPVALRLDDDNKPNQELKEFSAGYLDGFDWLLNTWQALLPEENHEAHRTLSVLNFMLARFLDEEKMTKAEPELCKQLPDNAGCLKVLPNLISGVGMLGKDISLDEIENMPLHPEEPSVEPFTNITRSVGRNDPCPCGSGKKFKKCCLH